MNDFVLELNYGPWLPANQDASILDLGCGDGRVLRFLASRGYSSLYGVDRDLSALSIASDITRATFEHAEVDAQYLRGKSGRFDLIIAKQMIYYIDRRQSLAFMRALGDALTDNGVLIIEYFNGSLVSSRFTELKDPFIRTAYTEHSMRRLIVASGLIECVTYGERVPVKSLRTRIYLALRTIWFFILKAILIVERGYDLELPTISQKSIVSIARRPPG